MPKVPEKKETPRDVIKRNVDVYLVGAGFMTIVLIVFVVLGLESGGIGMITGILWGVWLAYKLTAPDVYG